MFTLSQLQLLHFGSVKLTKSRRTSCKHTLCTYSFLLCAISHTYTYIPFGNTNSFLLTGPVSSIWHDQFIRFCRTSSFHLAGPVSFIWHDQFVPFGRTSSFHLAGPVSSIWHDQFVPFGRTSSFNLAGPVFSIFFYFLCETITYITLLQNILFSHLLLATNVIVILCASACTHTGMHTLHITCIRSSILYVGLRDKREDDS